MTSTQSKSTIKYKKIIIIFFCFWVWKIYFLWASTNEYVKDIWVIYHSNTFFFCIKHLFKCKDTQQKCTINAHFRYIFLWNISLAWEDFLFCENYCCTHLLFKLLRFKLTAHTAKTAKKLPTITNKITTIVTVVNLSALIVLSVKVV